MCRYQTLYHNADRGYVVRCEECGKLQLAFGNLLLSFSDEDFTAFRDWLRKFMEEQPGDINECIRNILVPTPCDGMKLLLSQRELEEFYNMLDAADTELRSLALLTLFEE